MKEQLDLLPGYFSAHLELALLALLLGGAVSLPLGVVLTRRPRLERWVVGAAIVGAASVVQTVPSLALLAVMVPLLSALGALTAALFGVGIAGIGFLPAVAALTLYSTLPLLGNTIAGIRGVNRSLLEAADGVGMTPTQRFWRVELPQALPVIIAGIRTATVWVVGMATLATPVGATSLGNFIFTGLQTRNLAAVLVGCTGAAVLALGLDALIRGIERGVRERRRAMLATCSTIALALYAGVGLSIGARLFGSAPEPVTIGAKPFTEQYILAAIVREKLERNGVPARVLQSLGSTVAFDALRLGQIDLYVDYSGTLWATVLERLGPAGDRNSLLEQVKRRLETEHGIRVVAVLGFENTYALAMRRADAAERGIHSISDLAPHARELRVAGDYELFGRPEWRAIEATYGLQFAERRSMDPSLMYEALQRGQVDVIGAYSTDGRIAALDLVVLRDDRGAIPPYDAILLAGPKLDAKLDAILTPLEGALSAETMTRLNADVDQRGRSADETARGFVDSMESTE
jgi:osmoprotectant transport system permease protein